MNGEIVDVLTQEIYSLRDFLNFNKGRFLEIVYGEFNADGLHH